MAVILNRVATTPVRLSTASSAALVSTCAIGAAGGSRLIDAWGGLSLPTTPGWGRGPQQKRSNKKSRGALVVAEVFAYSGSENWQPNAGGRNDGAGKEVSRFGGARGPKTQRSLLEKWRSEVSVKPEVATGGDEGVGGGAGSSGGTGGGGGDGEDGEIEGSGNEQNRKAAMAVLAAAGRSLDSLPEYLSGALEQGKIPAAVLERFLDLEKAPLQSWLMQFGGFRERLLADDLFLTKVSIECGVGLFTKTAAEYERRREKFFKELDFVIADVIMALVADFMLVWLPAPTVALRPVLGTNVNAIARFFSNCPDNAFQVALRGTSYSALQRVGAIVRNGAKLLVVGTSASLLGTAATNGLIKLRKTIDKDSVKEVEASEEVDVPILETSLAYGVYMAVSSNLRYQILAGVVEQRLLEPLLGNRKLALSASSFVVRTGNTFLGSLLWVDYARWVGVQ